VLAGIDFPVAVGQRLEIVDVQGCAVSKNAAPQNSSLVEEISGNLVWVEIQGKFELLHRFKDCWMIAAVKFSSMEFYQTPRSR